MTDAIRICACSLCVSTVAALLINMLMPQGNSRRIITVILGLFILCTLFSSVGSLVNEFKNSDIKSELRGTEEDGQRIYDEQVIKSTGDYISAYCYSLLSKAGVDAENIETKIGVNDQRGIYIIEINIYIGGSVNLSDNEITELISSAVSVEPKIIRA